MIRSELVRALARENRDLNSRLIEAIVDALFDTISAQLANGGRVELRDFGIFSTRPRGGYTGRNPRTGTAVAVQSKRGVHFKPGKGLSKRIVRQSSDDRGPQQI